MEVLGQALADALWLILAADADLMQTVWASLRFSLASTFVASLIGVPLGVLLATAKFPGRSLVITVLDTMLALPTVVVGLFVYAMVFRQGPLGSLGLLFTPWAIIVGQTILIMPIVTALSRSAVAAVDPVYRDTALSLGANRWRAMAAVLREARGGVLAACSTAFGRAVAEVGVSMMLGGNIKGFTRTITTVIALETKKGEFALALALGMILLIVAFGVNFVVRIFK